MHSRQPVPDRGRRPSVRVLGAVFAAALLCVATAPAGAATTERLEIVLDPAALPAGDRERFADRAQSIADATTSGLPLWRSFDARELLRESLAALARHGVDVETAIVNFDSLEADVPAGGRARLAALGFVREVHEPMFATASGSLDSEGLETIGSDIANVAGLTGAGVKVAIIDSEWDSLNATIAEGDLPAIPVSLQFKVNGVGTILTASQSADGFGKREHGTAAAEVVHEVAPDATLLAYRLDYSGQGLVTAAAIKLAIRHAADQGAHVILVPLHFIRTMSDPRGPAQGGNNPFADDISYAKAAGATVVVAAGNEALRHYAAQFTPCEVCNEIELCNEATDDSDFHIFDDDLPLNDLILDTDYDDFAYNDGETFNPVRVTCYSATDASDPTKFKLQLLRFRDNYLAMDPPDFPSCPRDPGTILVTEKSLGESFSNELTIYNLNFDDYYFLAVRRVSGSETPNFRVNCTVAVGELTYYNDVSSLSDLAVADDSLSVAGTVFPGFETVSDVSSRGPSGNPSGPVKPDISAPSEVTNFAVLDRAFTFWETFNGTSSAAAHVAGVVALLQSNQIGKGLAPYSVDQVKQVLFASAIELDDGLPSLVGPDEIYGHGLVQLPAAILPGVPGTSTRDDRDGDLMADPGYYDPATGNWSWLGSAAGEVGLPAFGGSQYRPVAGDYDGDGAADAATYDATTGNWTFATTTTPVAPVNGLGGGAYLPATGDYDGDGKTDVATFAGATGLWSYIGTTAGAQSFTFSPGTRWIPVPADYDGDGTADAGVFQKKKGKWRFRLSSLGGVTGSINGIGGAGWIPVPADFDGDGKADPAAYRKLNGLWRSQSSKTGEIVNVPAFGGPDFVPVVAQRP